MASFYIKTDLAVAGPFTGIEIREASLAGIIRPNTYLSHSGEGPWVAAAGAGLFCEKGNAMPHPAGTQVPTFQTRGMPGAFMGPFKLRELIGFACQGMLPPGTELQSDPSRPWVSISGTGILPACLRGDLVRLDDSGKLVLRTVIPSDLAARREQLKTLISPIERARQIQVAGATAAPLDEVLNRTGVTSQIDAQAKSDDAAVPRDAPDTDDDSAESARADRRNEAFGFGAMSVTSTQSSSKEERRRQRGPGMVSRFWSVTHERIGRYIRPQIAAAILLVLGCVIGLPVGYTAYKRMPLPRQQIVGNWVGVVNEARSGKPTFGIAFRENGSCVLMNATGQSWSGDFTWTKRADDRKGFRPTEEVVIRYDSAESYHAEGIVEPSDGHLKLGGFVKSSPLLDGHPVRDLYVRRDGDRLRVGYPVSAQWVDGERKLFAAWAEATAAPTLTLDIASQLREIPDESPEQEEIEVGAISIGRAIEVAMQGREFDYKGRKAFVNGCFAFSKQVDAGTLLERFGAPVVARSVQEFEKPLTFGGPSWEGASLLRYEGIEFVVNPAGRIVFLAIRSSDR
ncbi:hypothetical protein [Aporhodopirellula aestuarii]|uniref:GYF domain-containing protein n=1 Tax=Aporhodopirellula aestuarii TaxID=2950107 RepID=A0ABT0UCP2_9BACT|nr:hypothetical protein [Aporhodopirellula aestuarii]MCM2374797.1 hypothetical protein [Aporhodopirellula aestuarii]